MRQGTNMDYRNLSVKPLELSTINNECYKQLKDMILCGDLPWGAKIDIGQLATSFGISKFPVIKAIERLALEKILVVYPNRGTYVVFPTEKQIGEVSQIRFMIESFSCQYAFEHNRQNLVNAVEAVQQANPYSIENVHEIDFKSFLIYDRDFHVAIIRCAENEQLLSYYMTIRTQAELFRVQTFNEPNIEEAIRMHQNIIHCIKNGDITNAILHLGNHLAQVTAETMESLENMPKRKDPQE